MSAVLSCGLLQMDPSQFKTVHDYQVSVAARISSLARKGADLVVMPEYAGMIGASLEIASRVPGSMFDVARIVGVEGYNRWLDFFAATALSNRVHLCPGTFLVPSNGGYKNMCPFFSPKGDLLAEQLQTHASENEDRTGLICGDDLATISIRGHKLGIAMGTDAWYPEVGRILALLGVDTIIAPTAVPAPYTVWRQTRGLWQVVQQNQVFGVEASLGGKWLGTSYQDRSRVFAPVELTPEGRGVLAEIASGSIWGELVATLDPSILAEARKAFPIFEHFNIDMYEKQLSDAYLVGRTVRLEPERR
jgi:predicted amidohydrolase